MIKSALLVRLQAKKDKEAEVEKFLTDALADVENEPGTATWYAVRFGPLSYGIFDTFPNEDGRQDHLSGKVARALKEKSSELFSQPPAIEKLDVLAAKTPEAAQY
jgi:quinol monooxygenase YgiN